MMRRSTTNRVARTHKRKVPIQFFRLPKEIRNQIYELFVFSWPRHQSYRSIVAENAGSPSIAMHHLKEIVEEAAEEIHKFSKERQFHDELASIYYNRLLVNAVLSNPFVFIATTEAEFEEIWAHLPTSILLRVAGKLVLTVKGHSPAQTGKMMFVLNRLVIADRIKPENGWPVLRLPRAAGYAIQSTWKKNYRSVRTGVVVTMAEEGEPNELKTYTMSLEGTFSALAYVRESLKLYKSRLRIG